MRKVIVSLNLSLDGVMQAPGRPGEDERGGFRRGGWASPYFDAVMASIAAENMSQPSDLLFGRRTYMDFYSVWPGRGDGNPFTGVLNAASKYVVSNTLRDPLPWQNSILLSGDPAQAVAALKQQPGRDLVILGSGLLVDALLRRGLVDEYALSIHPLLLGAGRRLFPEDGPLAALELVGSRVTGTGVIVATYRPGSFPPGFPLDE